MKRKSKELDVDFIGGQGSLTKVEEQKISGFLKSQKLIGVKKQKSGIRTAQGRKFVS